MRCLMFYTCKINKNPRINLRFLVKNLLFPVKKYDKIWKSPIIYSVEIWRFPTKYVVIQQQTYNEDRNILPLRTSEISQLLLYQ